MNEKEKHCIWKNGDIKNSFISCRGDLLFEPDYSYCPWCGKLIKFDIPVNNINTTFKNMDNALSDYCDDRDKDSDGVVRCKWSRRPKYPEEFAPGCKPSILHRRDSVPEKCPYCNRIAIEIEWPYKEIKK